MRPQKRCPGELPRGVCVAGGSSGPRTAPGPAPVCLPARTPERQPLCPVTNEEDISELKLGPPKATT